MYSLNIVTVIKKVSVHEIKKLFFLKTVIKELNFQKKQLLFNKTLEKKLLLRANKLIEKIPHPCNAKEQCQSFIRKKQ